MELAHIANDISVFVGTLAKFLAILKINAVSVFVGTLAMFLALWSWPTTWAPNTSHNIGLYTVMVTFQVACSFCKIVDISTWHGS